MSAVQLTERACRECGCTEMHACPGGCWWVDEDLCSSCAANTAEGDVVGFELTTWFAAHRRQPKNDRDVLICSPTQTPPIWVGRRDPATGVWYFADGAEAPDVIAWGEMPDMQMHVLSVLDANRHGIFQQIIALCREDSVEHEPLDLDLAQPANATLLVELQRVLGYCRAPADAGASNRVSQRTAIAQRAALAEEFLATYGKPLLHLLSAQSQTLRNYKDEIARLRLASVAAPAATASGPEPDSEVRHG